MVLFEGSLDCLWAGRLEMNIYANKQDHQLIEKVLRRRGFQKKLIDRDKKAV